MSSDASKIHHQTSDASGHLGPAVHKIDHCDAWNVAHHRKDESNLARAYIELRQLAAFMWEGPITDEEQERLKAVIHSNDL